MIHEEEIPDYYPSHKFTDKPKQQIDIKQIYIDSEIDLSKNVPHPPTAISMGKRQFGNTAMTVPFGSYGDFSCVVGASKSKKTFFKSALIAGYISGGNSHFDNLKGVDYANKWVIDIDTEQSKYHSQRAFKRIEQMNGSRYHKYKAYSLREYSAHERMKFIDSIFKNPLFENNIGLVAIDGLADLITDINNIDQANELTQNLLRWSSESKSHIIGVLHSSYGSRKPTGHIGSAVMKKAETVAVLAIDPDTKNIVVECDYSRNISFNQFEFEVNNQSLPFKI